MCHEFCSLAARRLRSRMGRITGNAIEDVKVKVPRNNPESKCAGEVVGFLSCLDINNHDETACQQSKQKLFDCMTLAAAAQKGNKHKHKAAINYHIRTVRSLHRESLLRTCPRRAFFSVLVDARRTRARARSSWVRSGIASKENDAPCALLG